GATGFRAAAIFVERSGRRAGGTQREWQARAGLQLRATVEAVCAGGPAAGVSMLDDFPQDHWHHRGLFWSWPVVEVGGKKYDLWMTFTAKHRSVKAPITSGGTLRAENFWEAGGQDIVKEDLRLTVLPAQGDTREMDVELTWEALAAPVTLRGSAEAGKSYGGLSARF